MTILLTCRRCKGTGFIANEHFEICKALKSDATRRHFHVHAKTERLESDKEEALVAAECGESPTMECPQCNGEGTLEFDEDRWDVTVLSREDNDLEDDGA
jgi:RecJ-like exonuclease